jgi:hypothetical protein
MPGAAQLVSVHKVRIVIVKEKCAWLIDNIVERKKVPQEIERKTTKNQFVFFIQFILAPKGEQSIKLVMKIVRIA